MESPNKTKIQIGDFHLETEGSEAAVNKRIKDFKDIIQIATKAGVSAASHPARSHQEHTEETGKQETPAKAEPSSPLRKLFKVEGRIVTLEAMPQGASRDGDAFLLLLLGHKVMRGEDLIPVSELLQGLNRSGVSVDRIDEITAKVSTELWNKIGERRAGKFRLTVPGDKKARESAQQLVNHMT